MSWLTLDHEKKQVGVETQYKFDESTFGEGSSQVNIDGSKRIIMLTYTQRVAHVLDDRLRGVIETFKMPSEITEGWGMSVFPERPGVLLVSDGSNIIYECDSANKL